MDEALGVAKIIDQQTNRKLAVSFVNFLGFQLFWGDYWIIYLDPDYQYVLIGEPDREYGWVLSRKRKLSESQWKKIEAAMIGNGYQKESFELTPYISLIY